ncbi:MAG: hypothetical protein IKA28_05070, partial [Tidjanibacter sp.]|nr:hypothetical protein [Tidjanibacter sp.]
MTKILVIDSQCSVRNSLGELLKHEGFEVRLVEAVSEAAAAAAEFHPNLIICGEPEGFVSPLGGVPW